MRRGPITVRVWWISWHEDILARHYADQGGLEAMLSRSFWTPSDPIIYEHREVRGDFPRRDGALVVLPARHHGSDEDVERLKANLARLRWSVLILAGCELWDEFPWDEFPETKTRKVWTMQPIPQHAHLSGFLPGGPYPWTIRPEFTGNREQYMERPLDWAFGGQVTHVRRKQLAAVLRHQPNGWLHETDGYLKGESRETYMEKIAGAKVVPCASGPVHMDTARSLETMECGGVPICDRQTPRGMAFDYTRLVFGEDCPIREVDNWNTFPQVLQEELADWPHNANRTFAFWQQWKRRITWQLDDNLRAVMGRQREFATPDDAITVLVTSSPIPSHPSTEIIEHTINSIREQLPRAEILIGVDGVRPEQEGRTADYAEYVRKLLYLTNYEWSNVVPFLMPEWLHQANTARALLCEVRTPLVLFVEHDTPIRGEIDWEGICEVVREGRCNHVRLHHEDRLLPEHKRVFGPRESVYVGNRDTRRSLELIVTYAYWARPSIMRTQWFSGMIEKHFPVESRTMIEDVLYGLEHCDVVDNGRAGWWDNWRTFVLGGEDGTLQKSYHLDGRDSDPKYGMWLEMKDDEE